MKITVGYIRRELALLIQEKKKTCTTEKEVNVAVEEARREINTKYGKGWRDTYPMIEKRRNYNFDRPYDAQELGDEWDHYPWSADDF